MSTAKRFSKKETAQLAALAETINFTREHLARSESLRVDELPLDEYEQRIMDDYRSHLRAVAQAFERLMDLRLERSPDAEQAARAAADGYELLCALQGEIAEIVDSYFDAYKASGAIE